MFSSGSEDDHDDSEQKQILRDKPDLIMPTLEDCIVILYFAALSLGMPIMVADIQTWLVAQDFPYIDPLASLPSEMRSKLPRAFSMILSVKVRLPNNSNRLEVRPYLQ